MSDFTAAAARVSSRHGSARTEPSKHDKSSTRAQILTASGLESIMKRRLCRTEPISTYLERHRECLERHRMERGRSRIVGDDRSDVTRLPLRNLWSGSSGTMPFERRADDE